MSDESQNDKFAGDLISGMENTVRRAESKNGGVRNSQTANAGDVTYETVTKAYAETCRIASERTNGAYRCTRGPHADGPCAAVPVLRYTGPEIKSTMLGIVEQVPCDHPEPCGFKHWEKVTPRKPGDLLKTDSGQVYISKDGKTYKLLGEITHFGFDLAHRTRWERIKDWFRQPKWKKKPGQITTDSMGNDWLNVGKFNVQTCAHDVKLSPEFIRELEKYPVQESGDSTEREQPSSTLTFWHRITIMVVAFQMLRINKQPFNWRSIPELVRYLFSGKLPGMDKPFKAETLKAFGIPAEKFAHNSECEFQPKSAEHDQIDCTCQPRTRPDYFIDEKNNIWRQSPDGWKLISCAPGKRLSWGMFLPSMIPVEPIGNVTPFSQSEHTIENSNPTQNARNKQHHHQPRTPSERYAIIYLCIIAALWLLSLIVGIVFNWPAYR